MLPLDDLTPEPERHFFCATDNNENSGRQDRDYIRISDFTPFHHRVRPRRWCQQRGSLGSCRCQMCPGRYGGRASDSVPPLTASASLGRCTRAPALSILREGHRIVRRAAGPQHHPKDHTGPQRGGGPYLLTGKPSRTSSSNAGVGAVAQEGVG